MADAKNDTARSIRVPEFLREPLEAAQARLEQFEGEAQKLIKDLMDRGRASRKDLEQMVHRLSKQDWTFPEFKTRLEKLQRQGAERLLDLQSRAVSFLGVATREQIEDLSKELDRLARRLDKAEKGRRPRKAGKPSAEV